MTAAAFRATIHGFRTVPTRKVVQVTIEAPIEQHAAIAAIAEHGAWVAVARLQPAAVNENAETPEAEEEKERRQWPELTPTVQAVLRCKDPIFQRYVTDILEYTDGDEDPEKNAATYIRTKCKVNTRSALTTNNWAGSMWGEIDRDFLDWKVSERVLG